MHIKRIGQRCIQEGAINIAILCFLVRILENSSPDQVQQVELIKTNEVEHVFRSGRL